MIDFNLGKYFKYSELIKTNPDNLKRLQVTNNAPPYAIENLKRLVSNVLDPLREWYGKPVFITSGYRCEELNKMIGSQVTSQHIHGHAVDFDLDAHGPTENAKAFHYIKDNLDFDQLIWEFGDDTNPAWVHVSYVSKDLNRKKVTRALKVEDKTIYQKYEHK